MSRKNTITNRLIDQQTGRTVYTSALTNLSLAGWENFQDGLYTPTNKLLLPENTPVKLTFNEPLTFKNFERQPQIGSTLYPIWDFNNQMFINYKDNINGNNSTRVQFVAEAQSSSTGVAVEFSLYIPNEDITIYRESKPLVKGTTPQRVTDNITFYYDELTRLNGCELKITALGDNIDIYNISLYTKNF